LRRFAQPVLKPGEELLDRVQVGGSFRQEQEPRTGWSMHAGKTAQLVTDALMTIWRTGKPQRTLPLLRSGQPVHQRAVPAVDYRSPIEFERKVRLA
jgi:hypothetical protein